MKISTQNRCLGRGKKEPNKEVFEGKSKLVFDQNILSSPTPPFFFFNIRVWTQDLLALARQALYHLSHSANPFSIGYFWDRVSLYAWAKLDRDPLIFACTCSWDGRCSPPVPNHWLRWGLANLPWAGLKQWSSTWSPPLKELGLLAWATAPSPLLPHISCVMLSQSLNLYEFVPTFEKWRY
jgi:hypothetical protein